MENNYPTSMAFSYSVKPLPSATPSKEIEEELRVDYPKASKQLICHDEVLDMFSASSNVVTEVRTFRLSNGIPMKDTIELMVNKKSGVSERFNSVLIKLLNLSAVTPVDEKPEGVFTFVANNAEYYIPVGGMIDVEAEKAKIEEELKYTKGFMISVNKKLGNERFVAGAPEQVVAMERKKLADAEAKVKILEQQLADL